MAGQQRVSVDVDSAAFRAGLFKAVGSLRVETADQLQAVGLEIQNAGRRFAPVDTGRLRSSWKTSRVKRDKKGSYVEIGTNVEYAAHVEFGTIHNRAQPFARPAFLEGIRAYSKAMRRIR